MKITIEPTDNGKWIIDTNQPEMSSIKDDIEEHANAIIKPLNEMLTAALEDGTETLLIELKVRGKKNRSRINHGTFKLQRSFTGTSK